MRFAYRRSPGIVLLSLLLALAPSPVAAQAATPEPRATLEGHRGGVTAIAFAKRPILATGSGSGTVTLWDAKTGGKLGVINEHDGKGINGVAFSVDGNRLAAGANGAAMFFDVSDAKAPKKLQSTPSPRCVDVAVSGDGAEHYHATAPNPKDLKFQPGWVFRRRLGDGFSTSLADRALRPFDVRALAGLPDADAR